MRTKTFSLLSVSSLGFAIIANLVAKTRFCDASVGVATAGESNRVFLTMLGRILDEGQMFEKTSYCSAVLGIVFWITSAVRRERSCHAVLLIFLFVFLLVEFVFV